MGATMMPAMAAAYQTLARDAVAARDDGAQHHPARRRRDRHRAARGHPAARAHPADPRRRGRGPRRRPEHPGGCPRPGHAGDRGRLRAHLLVGARRDPARRDPGAVAAARAPGAGGARGPGRGGGAGGRGRVGGETPPLAVAALPRASTPWVTPRSASVAGASGRCSRLAMAPRSATAAPPPRGRSATSRTRFNVTVGRTPGAGSGPASSCTGWRSRRSRRPWPTASR